MIHGQFWKLQDEAELRKIDAAAIRLLTKTGCRIEHEGLLDRMGEGGCRIDGAAKRCTFTERFIREVIEHFRVSETDTITAPSGWNPQHRLTLGGSFPHLLDWPSGERRPATRQDVVDMARMAHVMDEFVGVGRVLTCAEVDQRVEPLWTVVQLAEITDKPINGGESVYANTVEPLVRMGEVLSGKSGDTHLVPAADFWISPLIFDRMQAECFLEKRKFGMPTGSGTMVISGISGPVTLAGSVALGVAEILAGLAIGYVVNPDLGGYANAATGSMDLRTMTACFGSPEALLQDAAIVQMFRRLYGIHANSAAGYVDCKRPGIEATFQKMLPLVTEPFGIGGWTAPGLLSAGQDYSPVQHVLDAEIEKAVERFQGHFDVDDDTLAVELVERVIASGETNFLDTPHTLAHYRAETWYPRWFDRSPWQGPEQETRAERAMLERIDAACKDAIRRYERPDIDQAKLAELRDIYRVFEREVLG